MLCSSAQTLPELQLDLRANSRPWQNEVFVSQCSHNRTKEILSIPSFHCPSLVNWVHHSWSFNELSCWSCCSLTWHSIQGVIPTLMPSVPGIISRYIRMKQLMKIIEGVEGMKKGRKLNQTPEGTFIYLFFFVITHNSSKSLAVFHGLENHHTEAFLFFQVTNNRNPGLNR